MRFTGILLIVVLVVSLVANAWFINERLEKRFYQKGMVDGSKVLNAKIIEQIQKTGMLNVNLPDGQKITMAVKPSRPPVVPTEPNNE